MRARSVVGRRRLSARFVATALTALLALAATATTTVAPVASAATDSTAPTISVTRPTGGEVVVGTSATIAGSADDDMGVTDVYVQVREKASGLWLRPDGTWGTGARRIPAALATPGGASTDWSFSTPLAEGDYGFDVIARDAARNWSDKPWRSFSVTAAAPDTASPTVAATSPTSGAQVAGPTVTLAGTATDDRGVTHAYVQVRDNATGQWLRPDGTWGTGARRIEATLAAPGATSTGWSLTTPLDDGGYGFDVIARDAAGNWSAKPWTRFSVASTTADTSPPAVAVSEPTSGAEVAGPAVTLAGTATDDRGVTHAYVQVRDNATGQWLRPDGTWGTGARRIEATLDAPGAASTGWILTTTLPDGGYGFDVIARDAARNWSAKPWTRFDVVAPVPTGPSRVALTPTDSPTTSQSVSWLAPDDVATAQLELQPVAGGATRTLAATAVGTVNGNPHQHFSVTIEDLSPATGYRYRVGRAGRWSDWHGFTTASPSATDFSFLYYGDAQQGLDTTWPRVVRAAEARVPQAAGSVHAGDLVNNADREVQWEGWFAGMGDTAASTQVLAAPGNHEYLGDPLMRAWKASFEYPRNQPSRATIGELADLAVGDTPVARQHAAYFDHFTALGAETVYVVDYQGVRFVTLNATRDLGFLTPDVLPPCSGAGCPSSAPGDLWIRFQAAWLDGVLARSGATWNVVTFHQPVFSAAVGRNEPIIRRHWRPVLQDRDVDLVLMGHDHSYARGYDDRDATSTPGLTTGPVYVVSNSGPQHYQLETDPARNVWLANGATQVRTGQGVTTYQVVDVTDTSLRYRSWLVEKGATADTGLPEGALFDEFTVTRAADGRKWVTEPGVDVP